jgi:hypothetical protein
MAAVWGYFGIYIYIFVGSNLQDVQLSLLLVVTSTFGVWWAVLFVVVWPPLVAQLQPLSMLVPLYWFLQGFGNYCSFWSPLLCL